MFADAGKKNLAFTLAEVMIALGIIGVIAAITLPILFNAAQDRERIVKFKKMYTDMAAVAALVAKGNGGSIVGAYSDPDYDIAISEIRDHFKSYFKDATDCNGATCKPTDNALQRYKLKNKLGYTWEIGNGLAGFILPDGGSYTFAGADQACSSAFGAAKGAIYCSVIYIDLNGPVKGPNALGWDFYKIFLGDGFVDPVIPEVGDNDCSTRGWGCSGYILQGNE